MILARLVAGMVAIGLMVLGATEGSGQIYPNKPLRILSSGPGGSADFVTRLIAQGISGPLGQPVIVENRPGGIIIVESVSKALPDGYTLLLTGSFWILPLLQKVSFDPVKDFSPITLASTEPNILAVHPSLAAKSVKELIVLAKARPGELNYGSGPPGGTSHIAAALFNAMAGVNIVRVPYKSSGLALTALIGSEVQLAFIAVNTVVPHAKAGRLRALAITSAQPSALMPDLPTLAASGLPGYEAGSLNGVFAPAKTPAVIINRLNREIVRFLNLPDTKERLLNSGTEAVGSSPKQLAAAVKSDMATIGKLIKDAGIRVD